MSKKRRASAGPGDFEELEKSMHDELYDILYRTGSSSSFRNVLDIFNKPFNVRDLLSGFESVLADLYEDFTEGTNFGFSQGFLHLNDVITVSGISKSSGMRKFSVLHNDLKKVVGDCIHHPVEKCKMIDQDVAFLLYLTWMDVPDKLEEEEKESIQEIEEDSESAAVALMEVEDEEVQIEPEEERALVEKFNTAKFKAETITKVEDEEDDNPESGKDQYRDLACLPMFPTYIFNGREYVLLGDIQWLFDLREDYCLACLARWGDLDNNFVDSSPCPIAVLDTKGADFKEKEDAALFCTQMIEKYEEQGLPTEEEFHATQEKLGITNMGKEERSSTSMEPKMDETKSSIDIYREAIFEMDEEPQVRASTFVLKMLINDVSST